MVRNDTGQLYTIEGFAAALIMVITAYLVVNATSIYTAGDTHINDMQLETLGSDALTMMGTPMNSTENNNVNSTLQRIIETGNGDLFHTKFLELVNNNATGPKEDIQFNATYSCRKTSGIEYVNINSSSHILTGAEHPVRATKWVIVDPTTTICGRNDEQAVLVEVLLWRD